MQYRLEASARRRLTRRYLALPPAWHQRQATGNLLSHASSDVESAWFPLVPLPFAVGTAVMLVAAFVSLFLTDRVFALIGVAIFPALLGLYALYASAMSPRFAHIQRLRGEVSAIAHESFDGALVVKTMGREDHETARFVAKGNELRAALISIGRLRGVFEPTLEALPSLGTLAILLIGTWRLSHGEITVSELVSTAFLFTLLGLPLRAIGWLLTELPRGVAGWDRVQQVISAGGDMPYGERVLGRANGPAALRLDRATFAYESAEPVLHEVSFALPAGHTVALVGPTGSGKSTIVSLAARLIDPRTGTVELDGVDARELSAASLSAAVAVVPQIPFVFDDTIRANVALERPGIDDAAVWAALRLAQADGFVARLPEGLDTEVGERGISLSGGQRQRLTLARALAGRPRLLLLDDATSAVDPRVEAAILAALRGSAAREGSVRGGVSPDGGGSADEASAPASILVVAYRRATIALADQVVYLERGTVIAIGTHARLLATVPGYADLVTAYEKAEAERQREIADDLEQAAEVPV
jgi:ABC-type multidrug transport system fused ATPase/permease subunit